MVTDIQKRQMSIAANANSLPASMAGVPRTPVAYCIGQGGAVTVNGNRSPEAKRAAAFWRAKAENPCIKFEDIPEAKTDAEGLAELHRMQRERARKYGLEEEF